ncbi:succinyl-CoA ligase [ADP-forming] subunit alpha [bacterium BMS3Abin04]|nr:succinyl-CoA ligase [ADP-forming] subunit alpha [bacterium BMS3Abin04]
MNKSIAPFFYPNSICIVGASTKEKSIGYEILNSIISYGYMGKIFPVNPKAESVLKYKCYHSIEEITEQIDLAVIVVPKKFVEESIDELLNKNIKSILLITAGFREIGKEGEELEARIVEKVKAAGARLVGPNCMGVINSLDTVKLNATFVAEKPEKGVSGFFSQSGALGAAVLNSLRETDIRFAHFISAGNKADITENDILKFWLEDENIKILTFYLESFENGLEFTKLFKESKNEKPVIILKAGRTKSGMKAASSHTGALSNDDRIIKALFQQFGIIRADTLNEMFNTVKGFEHFPVPKGNRIAVVTNAGGPAILAVDKLEERGLVLAEITKNTKSKLREIVHPEGSINNPIDLLPGAAHKVYQKVNELALEDDNVDAVVSIFVEPVMVNPFEVIEAVNSIHSDKPIYQVCMPLPEFWSEYEKKSEKRIPIFRQPEDPAEIISNILHYEKTKHKKYNIFVKAASPKDKISESTFLDQTKVTELCRFYDIPIVEDRIFTIDELEQFNNFEFPLVLKGLHKKVIHKSELNAVKLGIKSNSRLLSAAREMLNNFSKSGFELKKFLVQPFIKSKFELLLGGLRDLSFGPVVMFGTGGKYVEVLDDISMKSAFLTESDIDEMINSTKIGKILNGVRGETSTDLSRVKVLLKSASRMLIENEDILEFDFNPVIVSEDGLLHVVDVRIKLN